MRRLLFGKKQTSLMKQIMFLYVDVDVLAAETLRDKSPGNM